MLIRRPEDTERAVIILKVSKDINELEERLTECLQGEDKALFLDFCNAYGGVDG